MAGELTAAELASRRAATMHLEPVWSARFRLQHAKVRIYQGFSAEALALLEPSLPANQPGLSATRGGLLGIAYSRTGDAVHAQQALGQVAGRCPDTLSLSGVQLAQGVIDGGNGNLAAADRDFSLSLAGARTAGDRFLETQALLNLGIVALREEHYDDALQYLGEASSIAKAIGARLALEKAAGAYGNTFYKVGDYKAALANSHLAEEQSIALGSPIDQVAWLDDEGESQFRLGDLAGAKSSYERSLELARSLHDDEGTGDALTALAWLSLQAGELAEALKDSQEAQQLAARRNEATAALQPALVQALVLARRGQPAAAKTELLTLDQNTSARQSDRWQVEHALARLNAEEGDDQGADIWFRQAIATFRTQRSTLKSVDSQLPFLENGSSLYLGYMEQLIREGRTDAALAVLDQSRGETLAEGLGSESGQSERSTREPEAMTNGNALARRAGGTILVYCLRPGISYLWAIGTRKTAFFRLPGQEVLLPLVAAHTQAILAAKDVLSLPNAPGAALYKALVAPAAGMIAPAGKVFVVADETLNTLNFETLLPPGGKPHFWIEDADVINARSISLLAARPFQQPRRQSTRRLLLVGDPVYDRAADVKLPHAAEEVASVAHHFSPDQRLLLTGAAASPTAYQRSHPESFAYIHFVAHANASELNPLDSSIILSPSRNDDSYKLYARSILDQRLSADLVTISACYGSGVRSYSGEGLVGLAWAFLHTGSHHVIGALWEVSDASTPLLMSDLYDSLAGGSRPDVALRSAKLAMIHRGGVFRKAFYWGAFQLYSGA